MRAIKFKAIDLKTKEWRFGNYIFTEQCTASILDTSFGARKEFPVICNTVCQFTGITDKNGKEIYEGDILCDGKGNNGAVQWIEALGGFRVYVDNTLYSLNEGDPNRNTQLEYTEVIGNIHDK